MKKLSHNGGHAAILFFGAAFSHCEDMSGSLWPPGSKQGIQFVPGELLDYVNLRRTLSHR